MIKNTAGQVVAFQMISVTDGSDVTTGTPTVYITGDGGVQATGTGTIAHEGMGQWTYAPVQSETNYNHAAYTMVLAGAVSQTVNVYPVVLADYKADVSALATDAALAAHDTSIDTQLANIPTIAEFNARTIPAADYVVVTDTIAGVTDVTNLHASAATATTQTTILNRLGDFAGTGLNSIKGFLQAIFRSDGGVTGANTPSEINEVENTIAGTFDGTTDSIEAIRNTAPLGTAMRGTDGVDTAPMRGTDLAALASVCTEARLAELDAANLPATIDSILTDTNELQTDNIPGLIAALNNITVADIIAGVSEGTLDLQEILRIILAGVAGKSTGGGTATINFRDQADLKNRVTATVDVNGNRTAITVDGT